MAIKKLKSGRYQIDYRDREGVRHRASFIKWKDAQAAQDETRTKVREGTYIAPKKIPTFGEVALEWIGAKVNRRPSSIAHWQNHLDRYLLPALDKLRLDKIDDTLLERLRDKWLEGGLSVKSVSKILTTAGAVFKRAIRKIKGFDSNPAALVDRIPTDSGEILENGEAERDGVEVREEDVYTPEEVGRMIDAANGEFDRTILMAVSLTGVRSGEAFALQWPDFDFTPKNEKVTVKRSLSWVNGQPRFFTPKTKAGIRAVPLPPELVSQLKKWKLRCPPSEKDLIFPTESGSPAHRSNVLRGVFYPAMARAKLRRLGMHSLRHTYASLLLAQGTPITEVSYYLGHSSPVVTMKVYAHWLKTVKTDSVNKLAGSILGDGQDRGHFTDTSGLEKVG